jgi:hypothetical protein
VIVRDLRRSWVALAASLALLSGGALPGCAAGELSHDEYERLPRDARQEIFDAENDLVIARNRQDDAEEHKRMAERARGELDARWKRASDRLEAAKQGAKVGTVRRVFDAHIAYLDSEVDVATAEIRATRAGTELNRSRLELVRQRELARIGRATVGSLKELEAKVASLEAAVKDASTAATTARTRASTQLEAWKTAEDSYAQTGDYDTIVWGD